MFKKLMSLLMSFVLLTFSSVYVLAADQELDSDLGNSEALRLSNNTEFFAQRIDSESINTFNSSDSDLYLDYQVILTDNDSLSKINANKMVELIDNGTTLLVEDDTLSLKEVAQALNLDEPDNRFVRGAQVTGVAIFNQNDNYCYCILGVAQAPTSDQLQNEKNDPCYEYEPIPIYQSGDNFENITIKEGNDYNIDINDFIASIEHFRTEFNEKNQKTIEKDKVYLQLPEKGFDGAPYYNYMTIYGGNTVVGSYTITQYRYNVCEYREGKIKKKITDVVTTFTIASTNNCYVSKYKTRMHANISNMDIIGQSYLNSNSTSSYTLSGGFSASSEKVISGSIEVATTNNYTTNNQEIQNDFFNRKYKNWNVDPTKNWANASWQVEPCIRVLNTNASSYLSQAYSSFREMTDASYPLPEFEVGGSW